MAELALNVRPTGAVVGSRRAEEALDRVKRAGFGAEAALTGVGRTAQIAGRALGLAAIGASAAVGALAASGIGAFRNQSRAIAEVSTLIEGTTEELDALDEASKRFAQTYGGSATQQVQAFYQAISAGVGDVTDATEFLETANRLAVAGVTDVTTAVNILTSAISVYEQEGLTAAEASDALFVAVRAGKTTVDELSASLGRVLPNAKAAGVSFEETAAAVAALTTSGIATAEAVTGVRAILQQIIKPSKEAADLAKDLGLEFNVAALQAKGFADFMAEVQAKTGGATDQMAILFSGAEALTPALSLSGGAAATFANTLDDMTNKLGVTATAADKVAASLEQRFQVQVSRIQTAAMTLGEILFTGLVPALEATVGAVQTIAENSDVLAVGLVALASTQIPTAVAAIATLTTGMSAATIATTALTGAVTALRVGIAFLGGPIGIAIGAATAFAGALFLIDRRATPVPGKLESVLREAGLLPTELEKAEIAARNAGDGFFALGNSARDSAEGMREAVGAIAEWKKAAEDAGVTIGGFGAEARLPSQFGTPDDNEGDLADFLNRPVRPRPRPTDIDFGVKPEEIDLDIPSGGAAIQTTDDLRTSYEELLASLDPVYAKTLEYNRAMETLTDAKEAGAISSEEFATAEKLVAEQLKASEQAAGQLAQTFARTATEILTRANSAADAVANLAEQLANSALQAGLSTIFQTAFGGTNLGTLFGMNARGTNNWSGGLTWVGEEGPELVDLPSGSRIHSASQSAGMGGNVNISIDARGAQRGVGEEIEARMAAFIPQLKQIAVSSVSDYSRRGYV